MPHHCYRSSSLSSEQPRDELHHLDNPSSSRCRQRPLPETGTHGPHLPGFRGTAWECLWGFVAPSIQVSRPKHSIASQSIALPTRPSSPITFPVSLSLSQQHVPLSLRRAFDQTLSTSLSPKEIEDQILFQSHEARTERDGTTTCDLSWLPPLSVYISAPVALQLWLLPSPA